MAYKISVSLPGRRAKPGTLPAVTINEDGVPWPIILRFAHWREEDGTAWWGNVGFELGPAADDINEQTTDAELPEVDPVVLERIALAYPAYVRIAKDVLAADMDSAWRGLGAVARGRGRRGLSDDFLRRVQAEAEAWYRRGEQHVAPRIADAYNVDRTTASRWLKRAAELKERSEGDAS
jgi:hypothetical protein